MPVVNYGSLPFDEAVDFFRGKLNTPTERWNDIWEGAHTRSFVVAGAMKDDLLTDIRQSVDAAIADGESFTKFKANFKDIVKKHGWDHTGSADWRARIIYQTNMRQAHNAGRWQQLQSFEFWQYKHGDSVVPRLHHLAWHDKILPKEHPWWRTHFPQNGWGCHCRVTGMSKEAMERRGLSVSKDPSGEMKDWVDKSTGEIHQVPVGIDPGFAYSVGEASMGRQLSAKQMAKYNAQKGDAWEVMTPGNWKSHDLPEKLPFVKSDIPLVSAVKTPGELQTLIESTYGKESILPGPTEALSVYVNAASLAEHWTDSLTRSRFVPLLSDVIANPQEVWGVFEKHKGTGKVELKRRYIKMVKVDGYAGMLLVAQVVKGVAEAWTFVPAKASYLAKQRVGSLLFSDSQE